MKTPAALASFVAAALCLALAPAALGAGSPRRAEPQAAQGEPASAYQLGLERIDRQDYAGARRLFEQAYRETPNDPDLLNMLAYSQRKTGQIEKAIATYKRALSLKPDFPQAREYLGEAYLQAALGEVAALKQYGADGRDQHDRLVTALREAAAGLSAPAAQRGDW